MIIDCVYKDGNMCRAVNKTIEDVINIRGWGCGPGTRCGWIQPGATGKDRDGELIAQYRGVKKWKPDDILYWGQLAGHEAVDNNDVSTICYEACMLALFMNKQWKYLSDHDFCVSVKHAKRLGFRIPTNANKAYRIRIKRNGFRKKNRVDQSIINGWQ